MTSVSSVSSASTRSVSVIRNSSWKVTLKVSFKLLFFTTRWSKLKVEATCGQHVGSFVQTHWCKKCHEAICETELRNCHEWSSIITLTIEASKACTTQWSGPQIGFLECAAWVHPISHPVSCCLILSPVPHKRCHAVSCCAMLCHAVPGRWFSLRSGLVLRCWCFRILQDVDSILASWSPLTQIDTSFSMEVLVQFGLLSLCSFSFLPHCTESYWVTLLKIIIHHHPPELWQGRAAHPGLFDLPLRGLERLWQKSSEVHSPPLPPSVPPPCPWALP